MASSEHNTARACAFCGLGEGPTSGSSHGICTTCASTIELSDDLVLVRDPELKRKVVLLPVVSDNIDRAGWRQQQPDGTGILIVRFKGNAKFFRYINVPHVWWIQFLTAESKGSFFHSTVRADKARHPFTTL